MPDGREQPRADVTDGALADNVGNGVLSSYNGGISDAPTPRIDSLGADGLRLTNSWRNDGPQR